MTGSILTRGGYFSLTPRPACYFSPASRSVIDGGCRRRQVTDSCYLSSAQMHCHVNRANLPLCVATVTACVKSCLFGRFRIVGVKRLMATSSACINAAPTGRFFVEFGSGKSKNLPRENPGVKIW